MQRALTLSLLVVAAFLGYSARGWLEHAQHDHHDEDPHGVMHGGDDSHDDHEDDHDGDHGHDEDEDPHVALTEEAARTLGLRLGTVQGGDYRKTTPIPSEVVEFPGVSAYKLAAPVNGVVTTVAAEPGAVAVPGEPLFEVQITDERVLDAQLALLEALTRLEIVDEELQRLRPLAESGAVSGRQRRDLQYERRELITTLGLRRDELIVRGLPEAQVATLVDAKRLLRSVTVRVPTGDGKAPAAAPETPIVPASWTPRAASPDDFSIERLLVEPGQTVRRGQALCDLASHTELYLRVKAFERDVPLLARLADTKTPLSAEFGHNLDAHGPTSSVVEGLQIRYVANHVLPGSKAYACFIPLRNELLHESIGATGRRYRTWRFAVGQRGHVLLPTTLIDGHLPLPAEAVAVEGANAFVFVPHEHDDEHGDEHEDGDHYGHHAGAEDDEDHEDHEEVFLELEPLSVAVVHRDRRTVVVASGGELQPGDTIAMNAAYQLHLAVQAAADGGGGHHHHHH